LLEEIVEGIIDSVSSFMSCFVACFTFSSWTFKLKEAHRFSYVL
jgi:hypothetical protein